MIISGITYWVRDSAMSLKVAKLDEVPEGRMKGVKSFDTFVLLSNVSGEIYSTQDSCGHQKASLSYGTLDGEIVTSPLHRAKFGVSTGRNTSGIQVSNPPS